MPPITQHLYTILQTYQQKIITFSWEPPMSDRKVSVTKNEHSPMQAERPKREVRTPRNVPVWLYLCPTILQGLNQFQSVCFCLCRWLGSMRLKYQRPYIDLAWPPCQPGQIILVQNGLYRCPIYSTTCFMFNSHLVGAFQALWSQI